MAKAVVLAYWVFFILLVAGCDSTTSPYNCRVLGVDVPDGAEITGEIVEEHFLDQPATQAACLSPFSKRYGCAIPINVGRYVLIAVNEKVMAHERCHALFEVRGHVGDDR